MLRRQELLWGRRKPTEEAELGTFGRSRTFISQFKSLDPAGPEGNPFRDSTVPWVPAPGYLAAGTRTHPRARLTPLVQDRHPSPPRPQPSSVQAAMPACQPPRPLHSPIPPHASCYPTLTHGSPTHPPGRVVRPRPPGHTASGLPCAAPPDRQPGPGRLGRRRLHCTHSVAAVTFQAHGRLARWPNDRPSLRDAGSMPISMTSARRSARPRPPALAPPCPQKRAQPRGAEPRGAEPRGARVPSTALGEPPHPSAPPPSSPARAPTSTCTAGRRLLGGISAEWTWRPRPPGRMRWQIAGVWRVPETSEQRKVRGV